MGARGQLARLPEATVGAGVTALRYGSLFTGIGGLDRAVEEVFGAELAWYSEVDKDACKVLGRWRPGVPNLGDVKAVDWEHVEPVDVLCGGYPCQPFSLAGKRKGTDDHRHLWPWFARAIGALGPRIVVLENVPGHLRLGFDAVLGDLATLGFDAEWGLVRASDVEACHRRERLFAVAYASSSGRGRRPDPQVGEHHANREEIGRHEGPGEFAGCGQSTPYADRGPLREQPVPIAWGRGAPVGGPDRSGPAPHPDGDGPAADAESIDGRARGTRGGRTRPEHRRRFPWGRYEPAIARHERAFGRAAPWPVIEGTRSLDGTFTAWMMDVPDGLLDGLSNTAKKRLAGNAVLTRQATVAIQMLVARR